MFKTYQLTEDEWNHLAELSKRARSAPVMLVGNVDVSRAAYDDVQDLWRELGVKYGFDASRVRPVDPKARTIQAREAQPCR